MTQARRRVGIIGAGTIGTAILEEIRLSNLADVDYVLDSGPGWSERGSHEGYLALSDIDTALEREVDLVIEAATPQVLSRIAPEVLKRSGLCAFSCTALSNSTLEEKIAAECRASGYPFYVPHGAILALDGLRDGREVIESVIVTTTKSGSSLGIDNDAEGIVFEGPARQACQQFPRNVNVHAAIALAGIGFDKTLSRVVAVPGQSTMEHRLEVVGSGFSWDIRVSSRSLGGVSGAYTPRSAAGSVRRILSSSGITIA